MSVFVPFAETRADAERFWASLRTHLAEEYGLATTERRIRALARNDGAIEVGDGTPSADYEDVVMAILESADFEDMYFVATHMHGELKDPPYPMTLSEGWRVVEFE